MTLLHQAAQKAVEALTEFADAGADAAVRLLAAAPSTPEKAGGEKVHYWCNKCGYGGPVQVGHQRPNGTGECGYMAASAYSASPSPIPHPLPAQANDGGEQ